MATEYTGEKVTVNYFPSLDSYNTNKNSLSETDINFVPADEIVPTDYVTSFSVSGATVTYTKKDGTTGTFTTQNTTYSNATTSTAGLMSASDKAKLESLRSGGAICYGTCSTAKTTAAKVVTVTQGSFTLQEGQMVVIKFSNDLTNSGYQTGDGYITLNVNSSGAKKIRTQAGNTTTVTNYLTNWCCLYKGSHVFCYDGTDWLMLNNVYIGWTDWNNAGT